MKAEVWVNVAGCITAISQTEADRRLRRFSRNSALAVSTSFDPVLHCLRHTDPVIHQLEVEKKDWSLTSPSLKSVV